VKDSLQITFKVLGKTKNEAASAALLPALDSPHATIALGAVKAILDRRSGSGITELVRRLDTMSDQWIEMLDERPGRMTAAIRNALLSSDDHLVKNSARAILRFKEYDLTPALVNIAENESHPHAQLAADTLLSLMQLLYDELAAPRDYRRRRDPQAVRRHVLSTLELSIERIAQHKLREIAEAFLILVNPDHVVLKKLLQDPHHGGFLTMVDVLRTSDRSGIVRLLLRYLEDPDAPPSTINVIAHRTDVKFITHLLKKIGASPSVAAGGNLKRMTSFGWIGSETKVIESLDDAAQHAAIQMVITSGMKRLEAFELLRHLLHYGKPVGRRAAIEALREFQGGDANELIVRALEDDDPHVQASAVSQLRNRGIPGALTQLLEAVNSPHEVVCQAARGCLDEFSISRYLAAFDMLEDEARQTTGRLVKKIDLATIPALTQELGQPSRTRRLRALRIAVTIDAIVELEEPIIEQLSDSDHIIRAEAARALSQCRTEATVVALRDAMDDKSISVQEIILESLRTIAESTGEAAASPVAPPLSLDPPAEEATSWSS